MYDYNSKSLVSTTEREALKELIFKRARERAEALNKDTQEAYTTSIRNELMDIARDSFTSSGNPFAFNNTETVKETPAKPVETEAPKQEIGFAERKISENLRASIEYKNNLIKEAAAQNEVESVMKDAGMDVGNRKNFMGALEFLNSQASLSIINKRKHGFEAIA